MPLWAIGLLVTSGLQMAGSFMSQSLPVVAPLLTEGVGVGREQIGVLYALNSFGSILFMAAGTPLIGWVGPLTAMLWACSARPARWHCSRPERGRWSSSRRC